MVKGQARSDRELKSSSVLPMGAKFDGGDRTVKTIDRSNALRMFKKAPGSTVSTTADMFKPADPNSQRPAGHQHKGKDLHTDPFAMDRKQYIPPTKVLRKPNYAQPHATGIALVKPTEQKQVKNQMISPSGTVFRGGKVASPEHYETTLEREQPRVNYAGMARFKPQGSSASSRATGHVTSPTAAAPPADNSKHGIKRVHDDKAEKSLAGVLRMDVNKKPSRQFAYRPPWGTCNTPRTPPTNRGNSTATNLSPKPYACEA